MELDEEDIAALNRPVVRKLIDALERISQYVERGGRDRVGPVLRQCHDALDHAHYNEDRGL